MAKRKYAVQLSERAQKDFKAIQRYTLKRYSKKQVLKYSKMIKSGIENINENPVLYGHSRPDILERYRSHQVGENSIIYRMAENKIFIVAILHGSMDFRNQLQ
jgi:plasmid stabilization system protein ParE